MKFTSRLLVGFSASVLALSMTACGGGGEDDPAPVQPTVNLSGRATFARVPFNTSTNGLDMNNPSVAPVRGATVQVINAANQQVLANALTDANGNYSASIPQNTNVFVRVNAEMIKTGAPSWNFTVRDNTSGGIIYALDSAQFSTGTANVVRNLHAATGWSGASYTSPRAAAPFAILDSVYSAYTKILGVDPTVQFPTLVIAWSVNNNLAESTSNTPCPPDGMIETSHYNDRGVGVLCILGSANNDTDEFDDHVILHEWGHYFEDKLSRSDSFGGDHALGDRLDMRVAYSEGFGNAWSGIVTDDPFYRDSKGSQQANGFAIDVEANTGTNLGWYSEASVQSILYDLYDGASDGADSLTMGLAPLYQVFRNEQRTDLALTSIFSFAAALKANNPASAGGISAILNDRAIQGNTIDASGSTETNDAGDPDALPVYTGIAVNGSAVPICSTNTFGEDNKLGNFRFLVFDVTNSGAHTITASGVGADAVMKLFRITQIGTVHDDSPAPTEQFTENLGAGQHVLEVAEFTNQDSSDAPGGRTCMAVSITR